MPEGKVGAKTLEGILEDNHYPSSVDNMVAPTGTEYEGSANKMPKVNPAFGGDSVPVTKIIKTK